MERMEKRTDFVDFIDKLQRQDKYIAELEEENRNLKIEIGGVMGERDGKQMRIDRLEEENRKLKEDVDYRHHRCMVAERGGEDED